MTTTDLPSDIPAERALLGSVMLAPSRLPLLRAIVSPPEFYHPAHRLIFSAILAISDEGTPIDPVTVSAQLGEQLPRLEGGTGYLLRLLDDVPTATHAEAYAKAVAQTATLRRLAMFGANVKAAAMSGESLDDVLAKAHLDLAAIARGSGQPMAESFPAVMIGAIEGMVRAKNQGFSGLSTGFEELDDLIGGLRGTEVTVVAGRPSMGKTALGLTLAVHVARKAAPVLFFSLEMGKHQLAERVLAADARVNLASLRRGKFADQEQWVRILREAPRVAQGTNLWIAEFTSPTISQVRAEAMRWAAREVKAPERGLIVLDYVQLCQGTKSGSNRDSEIGEVSRGLKALSRELRLPVIVLSQLNRQLENRQDKRPQLSDLRESGSLEQDADIVIFLYRDEVYNQQTRKPGVCEIIVGKQRQGALGTVEVGFAGKNTRFYPLPRPGSSSGDYSETRADLR